MGVTCALQGSHTASQSSQLSGSSVVTNVQGGNRIGHIGNHSSFLTRFGITNTIQNVLQCHNSRVHFGSILTVSCDPVRQLLQSVKGLRSAGNHLGDLVGNGLLHGTLDGCPAIQHTDCISVGLNFALDLGIIIGSGLLSLFNHLNDGLALRNSTNFGLQRVNLSLYSSRLFIGVLLSTL